MAVLSDADRARVHRGVMRYWSHNKERISGITKADLRTAINETDDWIDGHGGNTGNTTGYNGAISNPFKSAATQAQKTLVFCAVAAMRVSSSFARQIFGDID